MQIYDGLIEKKKSMAVIGLGYVGMPIAIAFSRKVSVIGYDNNERKVELYNQGIDPTNEVGNEEINNTNMTFTNDATQLKKASFYIVAVPTPVKKDLTPNLEPLKSACKTLGKNLSKNSIVVFESTVYPGVTEEECIPILEKESGLTFGKDFKIGYSPERINPGDKEHRLENIIKVVAGSDNNVREEISKVYEIVVQAGIFQAESIKVAEAAKVIENAQRDINIAFMNELSIIFDKMNIDTYEVLKAAKTKWNFLNFSPGLVGGHCIGVDPYYLTYKASQLGYNPQVILAGREINDGMGKYITEKFIKKVALFNKPLSELKVGILGLTFKENTPDIRNTKVISIIEELYEYGIEPFIVDTHANPDEVLDIYNINLKKLSDLEDMDAVIIAVAHNEFLELDKKDFDRLLTTNSEKLIFDIKGIFDKEILQKDFIYWTL